MALVSRCSLLAQGHRALLSGPVSPDTVLPPIRPEWRPMRMDVAAGLDSTPPEAHPKSNPRGPWRDLAGDSPRTALIPQRRGMVHCTDNGQCAYRHSALLWGLACAVCQAEAASDQLTPPGCWALCCKLPWVPMHPTLSPQLRLGTQGTRELGPAPLAGTFPLPILRHTQPPV